MSYLLYESIQNHWILTQYSELYLYVSAYVTTEFLFLKMLSNKDHTKNSSPLCECLDVFAEMHAWWMHVDIPHKRIFEMKSLIKMRITGDQQVFYSKLKMKNHFAPWYSNKNLDGTYRLSPLWIRKCLVKLDKSLNSFEQTSQQYSFLPVCFDIWALKLLYWL